MKTFYTGKKLRRKSDNRAQAEKILSKRFLTFGSATDNITLDEISKQMDLISQTEHNLQNSQFFKNSKIKKSSSSSSRELRRF